MLKQRKYDMQFPELDIHFTENREIRRQHTFRKCTIEIDGVRFLSNDIVESKHQRAKTKKQKRKKKK